MCTVLNNYVRLHFKLYVVFVVRVYCVPTLVLLSISNYRVLYAYYRNTEN